MSPRKRVGQKRRLTHHSIGGAAFGALSQMPGGLGLVSSD